MIFDYEETGKGDVLLFASRLGSTKKELGRTSPFLSKNTPSYCLR